MATPTESRTCEHCTKLASPSEAQECRQALIALGTERQQLLAKTLARPACPTMLCASCLLPMISAINHLFNARQSAQPD